MSHDVLDQVSRNERRLLLRAEAVARKSGNWGPWDTITFPPGTVGNGWTRDITTAHKNRVFSVLRRDAVGGVTHFAVASLSGERPTWHEMQRIKNELAGHESTAVEVYPPSDQVIDEASMFHIWVLPAGLPFGLASP
jgi:hypothetical protein